MKCFKLLALGIFILFLTGSSLPQAEMQLGSGVEMRISIPKEEYLLGEPVVFDRKITIPKNVRARFENDTQGTFRVFVGRGNGEYLEYKLKGWLPSFNTIFFNSKPVTHDLADYYRRKAERGMILTDYAFSEPGEYRIKATYSFSRESNGQFTRDKVESNEVRISVKEPEGDDLKIWEVMQSNPSIGYFMMNGEGTDFLPNRNKGDATRENENVLAEVDKITSKYPDSYLAGLLKEKAAQHRARQERIKQEKEKARIHREFHQEPEKAIGAPRKN